VLGNMASSMSQEAQAFQRHAFVFSESPDCRCVFEAMRENSLISDDVLERLDQDTKKINRNR